MNSSDVEQPASSADQIELSSMTLMSDSTACHKRRPLKLCIILRQYSHSHLFNGSGPGNSSNTYGSQTRIFRLPSSRKQEKSLFKPSISTVLPKLLMKSLLVEFELDDLRSHGSGSDEDDVLCCVSLASFFNFSQCRTAAPATSSSISSSMTTKLESPVGGLECGHPSSRWSYPDPKVVTPMLVIGSNGVTICHLSQCLEDKLLDHLVADEGRKAEWLGVGLRLHMNQLYLHCASLLATGSVKLGEHVSRSVKSLVVELLDLASARMSQKLQCLTRLLPVEQCLQHFLSLAVHVNRLSPSDRSCLSNALVPLFGHVMSDPLDSVTSDSGPIKRNKYHDKFRRFVINNCFFNDLKAAKTMVRYGLVDEAFYIAKEKGCVLELFGFLTDNKYCTMWANCFQNPELRDQFCRLDQDSVLGGIGSMEIEIVARSDPRMLKALAQFVIDLFSRGQVTELSYKTTTHLCGVFNPFGSILDTLFRIHRSPCGPQTGSSGIHSLTDNVTSHFSADLVRLRRELGPCLLAYCLLVVTRDRLLHNTGQQQTQAAAAPDSDSRDRTYFVHMHRILLKATTVPSESIPQEPSLGSRRISRHSSLVGECQGPDSFESLLRMISAKRGNKSSVTRRDQLRLSESPRWRHRVGSQLLEVRDNFCLSVSVFEEDLFAENVKSTLHGVGAVGGGVSPRGVEGVRRRCQINMLGFQQRDRASRVLLLPREMENGAETVRQLALGREHALLLCESGALYGTGSNCYGQLGLDCNTASTDASPSRPRHDSQQATALNIVLPIAIQLDLAMNEQVLSVAVGDYHSGVVIVANGNSGPQSLSNSSSYVMTWGWGAHGQLGHGRLRRGSYCVDEEDKATELGGPGPEDNRLPRRLVCDGVENPVQLTMGATHTALLTDQGDVYTFGNNSFGQLGVQRLQKSCRPVLVPEVCGRVRLIGTRHYHTVCITIDGEIYNWGIQPLLWLSPSFQYKTHSEIANPHKIETGNLLQNETIRNISCGTSHTVLVTDNRLVYAFGCNSLGQLGLGNRREISSLVEVKVPKPIDFVVCDDAVTVAMNVTERNTVLYTWGKCSHPLINENLRSINSDTVLPQLLVEYQHICSSNVGHRGCLGVDTINSGGSTILNKQQLMIVFLNFSGYMDRKRFIGTMINLGEIEIVADYFLINEMLIESLFWVVKSLGQRVCKLKYACVSLDSVKKDAGVIFRFYIKQTERSKHRCLLQSVLTMITGFFKRHGSMWECFEDIMWEIMIQEAALLTQLFVKYSLESDVSTKFVRALLLRLLHLLPDGVSSGSAPSSSSQQATIMLTHREVDRITALMRTGDPDTVYDAADDHKALIFAGSCAHSGVLLAKFREGPLRTFIDRLKRRQLTLSSQAVQRLYGDSCVLPDCVECLSTRL